MVDVGLDAVTVGNLPEGLGLKEIGEGLRAGIVMETADTDVLLGEGCVAFGQNTFIFRLIQLVGGLGHLKGHQLVVAVALGHGLLVLGLVGLDLVIMLAEVEDRDANLGTDTDRQDTIFQKFMASLHKNYMKNRHVSYYVQENCLSPRYFSRIVKEKTGRTAQEWISAVVIDEARRLLEDPENSIKDVAFKLGFPNQSFFGRYFL